MRRTQCCHAYNRLAEGVDTLKDGTTLPHKTIATRVGQYALFGMRVLVWLTGFSYCSFAMKRSRFACIARAARFHMFKPLRAKASVHPRSDLVPNHIPVLLLVVRR